MNRPNCGTEQTKGRRFWTNCRTSLAEEIGVEGLRARAGVLSGEPSIGSGGNKKGHVAGDLVNPAWRLQSIAEPGTVLVGASTHDLVHAAIELVDIGAQTVKGKEQPVEAWRAVRVASGRRGEGRGLMHEPPLARSDE